MIGKTIAHYQILGKLGEGGMGEVYRARDSKLNREVALKVLPEVFAKDVERMARFQREAQVLASLNHPNIAAIHGLEESEGVRALVMELVEGPTLADRIATGPIPLDEVLLISRQMAEALEYAHERGIIHRDLKPANVKLTSEGTVKVLDFGLAKALEGSTTFSDPENSPTLTLAVTQAGVILGTAAYMAPEQVRGKVLDRRADIWSFGVVFYEMLTGKRLYDGETVSDTLAAVLKVEPDWNALPAEVPEMIRRLLRWCLTKDRRKRLQAIGDARIEIEECLSAPPDNSPAKENAPVALQLPRRQSLPWGIAGVLLLVLATVSLLQFRKPPPQVRQLKYSIVPPDKTTFRTFASSPDGRLLAFTAADSSGNEQLWLRPLDSLTAQPLTATDGACCPFWSPDSRFIAFFAEGKLKKTEALGGVPQTICERDGFGGTWSREGLIIFSSFAAAGNTRLYLVPAAGGEAKAIVDASGQDVFHAWASFLPDGRHFLYTVETRQRESSGIHIGVLGSPLEPKAQTRLLADLSNVAYLPATSVEGHLVFARNRTLLAQRFHAARLQLVGEPLPLVEQVGYDAGSSYSAYSVSENGVLVYSSKDPDSQSELAWFDRTGKRLETLGKLGVLSEIQLSPDEKQVAFERPEPQTGTLDLWLIQLARGISTRFTFASGDEMYPVWSPDAKRLIFSSNREGVFDLYERSSSGLGGEQLLLKSGQYKRPTDWSPDGRSLLYAQFESRTNWDLWMLPLFGDKKPVPWLQTEFNEDQGAFSPDGKWIAYTSDESGKAEVYVGALPGATSGSSGKWQVSKAGGFRPRWRRDGKELFYLSPDRKIMAVEAKTGVTLQMGVPQPLFEIQTREGNYAAAVNGQRFLIPTPVIEASSSPLTVVINWTKESSP